MKTIQIIFLTLTMTIAFQCAAVSDTEYSASAFGQSIDVWRNFPIATEDALKVPLSNDAQISWVCEVEGIGLGLCDSDNSEFILWRNNTSGDKAPNCDGEVNVCPKVSLAPLGNPVGAFQSVVDGLIYVACFGTYPVPNNDSGVAIIDVSDANNPRLVATHTYPHPHHIHNIYEFYHRPEDKNPEVFVAILGNPWMDPPVKGHGLVMVDRDTGAFEDVTIDRLNIRSAKQPSPGVFYALTQEPEPEQSKLVRLETNPVGELVLKAETILPPRDGGDGGADVILGLEPNTIWASDRWAGPGRLYYFSYDSSDFVHLATHTATGVNARYTVITESGDMVVCSEDSRTLSVMEGLALFPTAEKVNITTIDTVGTVQFFIESDLIPSSLGQ